MPISACLGTKILSVWILSYSGLVYEYINIRIIVRKNIMLMLLWTVNVQVIIWIPEHKTTGLYQTTYIYHIYTYIHIHTYIHIYPLHFLRNNTFLPFFDAISKNAFKIYQISGSIRKKIMKCKNFTIIGNIF